MFIRKHFGRKGGHIGDAVILFGDFNCKNIRWGCPSNNYNGIKLDELEDRLDFGIIAPSTSTCFPHVVTHRPSTIDIALTKGVHFISIVLRQYTVSRLTTDRCSYQPRQDSGRERAEGSILGSPEVSARYSELIRAKTQLCAARAHIPLPSTDPERELSNAK
ncbi:hypothetical protein EVAR_85705_1 [Eumeta japonica]|uniref:Endonuclease/exonuclease/phosphatase domain-containing protein n=1 Tax=Eumeta variegata TaxID=151549 RepID=A0A4C1Y5V3_EUMVA|nr:hypothetical protein EVAR_85705_1 [Eumeta japonica]